MRYLIDVSSSVLTFYRTAHPRCHLAFSASNETSTRLCWWFVFRVSSVVSWLQKNAADKSMFLRQCLLSTEQRTHVVTLFLGLRVKRGHAYVGGSFLG